MRQNPIHVAHEYLEQGELGWSQMDFLSRPGYAPSEEVNFERADSDSGLLGAAHA